MSETHTDAAETAATQAELFDKAELRQFAADDAEAGGAIGKMLSLLFIYTVIAMTIVSVWTASVSH
ncbi:hypothetical protein GC176_14840 [bacterium]|nr:hypothetical protein [bacterium]